MKTFATLLLGLFLFGTPAVAQDTEGLEDLAGIPVMDGLQERPLERIMFDKPEGRIIHAALEGDVALAAAASFYSGSLGQLGWIADSDTVAGGQRILLFSRDEESLTMTFSGDGRLNISIDIKPIVSAETQ